MKNQTSPRGTNQGHPTSGTFVATTAADFIPVPQKRLDYRGLNLSRSSTLRLINAGEILVAKLRVSGGRQGRTFIIRESLDAWLERELCRSENSARTASHS
jgi:hypothetical protein